MGLPSRVRSQQDPRREPAFERFVADASTSLLRSAYLLTGDRWAAEDVLQSTLLRTARRWRVAQHAPEAYARRVLVNVVRDRYRHAVRRGEEVPFAAADQSCRDAVHADHAEIVVVRDAVFEALGRLPAEQREVIVLRFYAGLSVAETAVAIGRTPGTVKSRTSRALTRMRVLLADPPPASAHSPVDEVSR